MLDGKVNKIAYLADKYAVREYVSHRAGDSLLPKLYGVWNDPLQIDFSALPEKFALKLNYGAGMNIICTDKSKLDTEEAVRKLQNWLALPAYNLAERHYNLIPRKIICEEFISDANGKFPIDYKILCCKGEPFCILVCCDRDSGNPNFTMYSTDWEWLPDYQKENPKEQKQIGKPDGLDEMLSVAGRLAEGIDLVRVDLYYNNLTIEGRGGENRIIFGEMTLTPAGCIFHSWTQKSLDEAARFYYSHKI